MKINIDPEQFQDLLIEYLRNEKQQLGSEFCENGKALRNHTDWAYDSMSELVYKIDSIQVVIDLIKDKMRTNVFSDGYIMANLICETMASVPASEFHGMIYDPIKDVLNTYDTLPCDTEPK